MSNSPKKKESFIRACQLVAFPQGDKCRISLGSSESELFDASVASVILGMSKLQGVTEALAEHLKNLPRFQKLKAITDLSYLAAKVLKEVPLSRSGFADVMERTFECLHQRGFVQTRGELLAALPKPREREKQKLSTLGIVTAGRPEALSRSLDSYLSAIREYGRSPRVVVADDSRDAVTVEQNKEVCGKKSAEFGFQIEYVGRQEREDIIAARAGNDTELAAGLRLMLFGYPCDVQTYGANRNALHLRTRGEVLLSVDDDTICNPFVADGFSRGVDIGVGASECETARTWPTRAEAFSSLVPYRGDPFAFIEETLGASLLDLSHQALSRPEAAFAGLNHFTLEELLLQQSRVALAMYGLVGDSGSESGLGFLYDGVEVPSPEYYDLASKSREITKFVKSTTVRYNGPCMTMFYGCDNRKPLPLFFPNFRNEDFLFKDTLLRADKCARVAYLPCLFEHSPISARTKSIKMAVDDCLMVDEFLSAALSIAQKDFHARENVNPIVAMGDRLLQFSDLEPMVVQRTCVELAINQKSAGLLKRQARFKEIARHLPKTLRVVMLQQQSDAERKLAALSRELLDENKTDLWPHLSLGSCRDLLRRYAQALVTLCR